MKIIFGTSSVLALAVGCLVPQVATAQAAPPPAEQPAAAATSSDLPEEPASEIVVTGSRLQNSGFAAPTPVTVVGTQLVEQRAPTAIAEVLLELPAFRNSNSQTGNQFTINTAGQNILDLRGLGAVRTLVLLDGRRFVPTSTSTTFDTNLIPTSLVERTEVVTGGASAQYGSDAVAGVVNFILKDKLEGLHLVGQYGQTPHDDNKEVFTSLGWGTSIAGGRAHLIIGAEYSDSRGVGVGVGPYARKWGRREPGIVTLTAARGANQPAQLILDNVESSVSSFGSLVVGSTTNAGAASTILRGTNFGPGGSILPFQFGTLLGTTTMQGSTSNYGTIPTAPQVLKVPNERFDALMRFTADVTDSITAYAEASYGHQVAETNTSYNNFPGLVITADNPYLPASVQQTMIANNLRSITLGRIDLDIGAVRAINKNDTYRGVVGARGKLISEFNWDVYYEHGVNDYKNDVLNAPKTANYRAAIAAVRDTSGNIVCGPIATNPNLSPAQRAVVQAGCVPYNVFGVGSPSAAALAYVTGREFNHITARQDAAGANITGAPFALPAGDVSLAVGAEYRKDRSVGVTPLEARQNLFLFGNYKPISGRIEVKEGYAEIGVPILKDSAFSRSLDLNGAVRYTDYSTSGGVTTWKVGATWEPISSVRLRFTRSRDIRAPNIGELFTMGGGGLNQIRNPANGIQAQVQTVNQGNLSLKPEIANTLTAGIVLQPTAAWARGFRASVDYYKIDIDGAIATVTAQEIVNRCAAGQTLFCTSVNFDPGATNGIASVLQQPFNANTLKTKGVDIELSYQTSLGSLPGRISLRALATRLDQLETFDPTGASLGDQAGNTLSKWRGNVSLNYATDRFSFTVTNRFFSDVRYSLTLVGPEDAGYSPTLVNSINKNRFPARSYTSLNISYNLIKEETRRVQLFGVVDNLFDTDPPQGSVLIGNSSPYDYVGVSFKGGVRVDF